MIILPKINGFPIPLIQSDVYRFATVVALSSPKTSPPCLISGASSPFVFFLIIRFINYGIERVVFRFDFNGSISDSKNFGLQLLIDCNSDSNTSPPEAPPQGNFLSLFSKENLPKSIPITQLGQCHETNSFKFNFASWSSASKAPVPEETRGKVAALLKQQQGLIKGQAKTPPVEEEVPPLLADGKFEMWRINGEEKTSLPKEDIGKFYCGDCYVCLYSYHSNEKKEDHYLCCWFGKDRSQEDQKMAVQQVTLMFTSMKGKPVQGRMYHGKEARQFVSIFQPMVILKGGLISINIIFATGSSSSR
ncbi:hypothetical protein L1887_08586 [Cichorium endivia]|nr:hypothetical protein L1887_08586 [Cichorium endivia]